MNLSYYSNSGSLLGLILVSQIITGIFLSMYYSNSGTLSFDSVQYIMYEVSGGWFFRLLHFNGANIFFLVIFLHLSKGLFYLSWRLKSVWIFGLLILLLVMGEAFLGYVLVWAQMSFWAGIVITSLLSIFPLFGYEMMFLVWGSFLFSDNSLKFFFVMHFILPFIIIFFIFFHLFFLHSYGSTGKNYFHFSLEKNGFFPFFWVKDFVNLIFFFVFILWFLKEPFKLSDSLIFVEKDSLVSPIHIVPEWYFLFAYAILRAIPNKTLGVVGLLLSVMIFIFFSLVSNYNSVPDIFNKFLVWLFIFVWLMLMNLGGSPAESPYVFLSYKYSVFYFFLIMIIIMNFFSTLVLF